MANIKSAKKRILVNQTKYERNKAVKSAVKTAIKKVEAAVAANDKEAANTALVAATKLIEMAGSKGIYHKNNVARKISRLTKLVNTVTIVNKKEVAVFCNFFFSFSYYILPAAFQPLCFRPSFLI